MNLCLMYRRPIPNAGYSHFSRDFWPPPLNTPSFRQLYWILPWVAQMSCASCERVMLPSPVMRVARRSLLSALCVCYGSYLQNFSSFLPGLRGCWDADATVGVLLREWNSVCCVVCIVFPRYQSQNLFIRMFSQRKLPCEPQEMQANMKGASHSFVSRLRVMIYSSLDCKSIVLLDGTFRQCKDIPCSSHLTDKNIRIFVGLVSLCEW